MEYIFCGNMFSDPQKDIKKMIDPPPVSSHKYQESLIRGLVANNQNVYIINIPRVRYYPNYPQILFKRKGFTNIDGANGIEIGFINLPVVNYISQRFSLKRELMKMIEQGKKYTLISFNNYLPQNMAMLDIRKTSKDIYICNILGDLHGPFGVKITKRYEGLRGKIVEKIEKKQDLLSAQSDAFGFLTKYMMDALGVFNKPFVVIEGMYSGEKKEIVIDDSYEKTIFYAGAVEEEYGLTHLLRAFSLINDSNYRLRIAGGGGAVREVKKYSSKDARIEYLGYLTPDEVEKNQRKATCLVNPRTSNHEYVKYAFPSKNMECLASGIPYVAHDLPCNPEEYRAYLQCPEDESDEALAKELVRVCSLLPEERKRIGKEAQEFILREKNPQVQCKKIVEMMRVFE